MNQIEIWNNSKNIIPLIVSIPHSGTYIPQTMQEKLVDNVVLANMDWYLPKLYSLFIQTQEKLKCLFKEIVDFISKNF